MSKQKPVFYPAYCKDAKTLYIYATLIIILPILYTALFLWLISRSRFFKRSGVSFKALALIFLLKILAGTGLTMVYTYYYTDRSTSDIYKYYDDGKVIYQVLKENPVHYLQLVSGLNANAPHLQEYLKDTKNWHEQTGEWLNLIKVKNFNYFNSNRLVTRFNAIAMLFSQGNIYVHVVFMCFLGLLGGIAIYRALIQYYKGKELFLLAFIFLPPGVLFWQSGVLKEGLLIFFSGIFFFNFLNIFKRPRPWLSIVYTAIALYFIVLCKYYIAIALAPGIIAYTWYNLAGKTNAGYKFAYTFLGLATALTISLYLLPQYNPLKMLVDKRDEAIKSAVFGEAKEILFVNRVAPYPANVAQTIPQVLKNIFLEPLKITSSPLILLSTLENLLIIGLLLFFIIRAQRKTESTAIFWFLVSYALILLFIIGFTTPVSGGIVRYKTAAIPFLLMAMLMLSKPLKIKYLPANWLIR